MTRLRDLIDAQAAEFEKQQERLTQWYGRAADAMLRLADRVVFVPSDIWAVLRGNLGAAPRVDDGGLHFFLATSQGMFAVYDKDTRPSSTATCLTCRGVFDVTYDSGRCQACDPNAWSAELHPKPWWRRE